MSTQAPFDVAGAEAAVAQAELVIELLERSG